MKMKDRSSTLISQYIKSSLKPTKLTKKEIENYFHNLGFDINECAYCGEKNANTLDHVFGVVKNSVFSGYDNDITNLIPCCQRCNSSKGNKTIEEWFDGTNGFKITKRAQEIKTDPNYKNRREKLNKYIKNIQPSIDGEVLKKMNKRAKVYKQYIDKVLDEMDKKLEEDKDYYKRLLGE